MVGLSGFLLLMFGSAALANLVWLIEIIGSVNHLERGVEITLSLFGFLMASIIYLNIYENRNS